MRTVLSLAATIAALLIAAMISGALAASGDSAESGRWHHVRIGRVASGSCLAAHGAVVALALIGRHRVVEADRGGRLAARARRNVARGLPFAAIGAVLIVAAAGLGVAGGRLGPIAHLTASALALGFNLGALPIGAATLAGQGRLLGLAESEAAPGPAPS